MGIYRSKRRYTTKRNFEIFKAPDCWVRNQKNKQV